MIRFEDTEILIVEKPSGIATHRPSEERIGFVEWLSQKRGVPLFPVHRLDAETSGLIIFARSSETAANWSELKIKKTYRFLTAQPASFSTKSYSSLITRNGNEWQSRNTLSAGEAANSTTDFQYIGAYQGAQISFPVHEWEAILESGKTHQIRLHAQALDIPILGDTKYGGTEFSRICLHAHRLERTDETSPLASSWISSLASTLSEPLVSPAPWATDTPHHFPLPWRLAARNRAYFLECLPDWAAEPNELATYRVLHDEDHNLRADRLGPVLWGYWYSSETPTEHVLKQFAHFASAEGCEHWTVRAMMDRGRKDYEKVQWNSPNFPQKWIAQESTVRFEFRADTGSSAGLFLDQRANRREVARLARARVLNLFCYTSGFSLAAAKGGARELANVDVQKSVLDWSRTNFALNGVEGEFWKADAHYFLERSAARGRQFDLIICDPPSFARNERGVFRIEADLPELLIKICACLAPQGIALLTTNFEGWTQAQFYALIHEALQATPMRIVASPYPDGDFEMFSGDRARTPILKSCWIRTGPFDC